MIRYAGVGCEPGGAVGLTKAILPSMVDRQEGHVVVVIAGEGGAEERIDEA